jgi:organic radical activating enzyme
LSDKRYPLAEKFIAPQGEGLLTGVMTAFIRLVGCSVGKGVCTHCDTDFDKCYENMGGGMYTATALYAWSQGIPNVCFTGGEPLDRDLTELVNKLGKGRLKVQIETSGTVMPHWLEDPHYRNMIHLTVSPKPGYLYEMIQEADEIKVIHGGLGDSSVGWASIEDAVGWAQQGKIVYLQPQNYVHTINVDRLADVVHICERNPLLRVSAQLHKFLNTR